MRYIKKNGELNDEKIVTALRKAAAWYEDGVIQEAYDLLSDICYAIEEWMSMQEE